MKTAAPACRLRDQRLTIKPRITRARYGRSLIVERLVPINHPAIRGLAQCEVVDTLAQAIATAHSWVGPKPQETP